MTLKIEKIVATVRGELWEIIGIVQNKFASEIPYKNKKEVQVISLSEMKGYVNSDKNSSTIASIFRSFAHSLNENYLEDQQLEELFNYAKAVMIPLKKTYDASISAL